MFQMALVNPTVVTPLVSEGAFFPGGTPPKECGSYGNYPVASPCLATESDRGESLSTSTLPPNTPDGLLSAQAWQTSSSSAPPPQ